MLCVCESLSCVQLFVTPWTGALQAPLSMGFSRHEYWSGLLVPSQGDLLDPGIKPRSPALQANLNIKSQGILWIISPSWSGGHNRYSFESFLSSFSHYCLLVSRSSLLCLSLSFFFFAYSSLIGFFTKVSSSLGLQAFLWKMTFSISMASPTTFTLKFLNLSL